MYLKILVITVIIVVSVAIIVLISLLTIPDNRQYCTFCPEMPSPNQTLQITNVKTNPFGIVGLMYYYGGGPCGVGTCPLNTFNLKMTSNNTAYLLGYNICDGNSCIVRNDLSILLPLNVIGTPNYKFIALPENPQWKYDDVFHIQVEVSSISDNKTAIWTDLGNSTIIH